LRPNDPALHVEMGTLLLALGHKKVGLQWLENAVTLKPDFAPAHAALAEYYRSQGETEKAAEHERQARDR